MALVFHRGLAIPLWAIAFFTVALAVPPRPMPTVALLLGAGVLSLAMLAMVHWRRTPRALVPVAVTYCVPVAQAGIIVTGVRFDGRAEPVSRAIAESAPDDDVLDLVRMDNDRGWQMAGSPAVPVVPIPGARERPMLTTFETTVGNVRIANEPSTMDAATTAERQREGGGAPSQRRPARARSQWLGHTVRQFLTGTGALFARRLRTNHV